MSLTFIGTTFGENSQWYIDEVDLIQDIKRQINYKFPNHNNLFINTTWFGPQFGNGEYKKLQQLIAANHKFDQLFLLAAADPVFLNSDQINNIRQQLGVSNTMLLGHFDSTYYFNFHSQVILRYFESYAQSDLLMQSARYRYVNYNRKSREHRIHLVNQLYNAQLLGHGIVTLGNAHQDFSNGVVPIVQPKLLDDANNYDSASNWGMGTEFGISHDIHSLGNMDIWRNHFLNIVGETEFLPWDNMFVSEKTWKPIIGLRPFVINGQTKIYSWLRSQGFKTFNHYFPVQLENVSEFEVHASIVKVVQYLTTLSETELTTMFDNMLPDLLHNRARFFEFAKEQQHTIAHLFDQ